MRRIPKVGGTKDVKLDRIRELAPTHAIVNVDENRRETAEELAAVRAARGRHPPALAARQPRRSTDCSAAIFGREREAEQLCARFEAALERLQARELGHAMMCST